MKIAITSEDAIDASQEIIQEYDFKIVHPGVLFKDNLYTNGELTSEEMFREVNNGAALPKTSATNIAGYEDFFTEILKEYDAIIHIAISSGISSMYNNVSAAAKTFDGKVEVVDSESLSTGMCLLAIYARELTKESNDIHEIAEKVRSRVKSVQASFVIERLDYLYKGGRCSSLALLGANILKIRPQIIVKDGKMSSGKKYRGPMPLCVKKYCEDTLAEFNTPCKDVIFITYSTASDDIINAAKEVVLKQGFKKVYITTAGPTISCHCGEHTLGILYLNDGNDR